MTKKIEKVVESYLVVDLEDFSSLIEDDLPENYHLRIRQVALTGEVGPILKLSRDSSLKVEIVDESKKSGVELMQEQAAKLQGVTVTDLGERGGEKVIQVTGLEGH